MEQTEHQETPAVTAGRPPAPPPVPAPGLRGGDRPPRRRRRPWRSIVFAPAGDGAARRRGSDAVRLVLAVVATLVCWFLVSTGGHADLEVAQFLSPPPDGLRWMVSAVWWLGSVGTIVVLAAVALVARRREIARDLSAAGLGAYALTVLLQLLWGTDGDHPTAAGLHDLVNLGFPLARIAATIAVVVAALPYLSRSMQRTVEVVVVLVVVATLVQGSGTPLSVVASLAVGWGTAALVHLVFGSPLGLPSGADVEVLLADVGVAARGVVPARHQVWGVARFHAADPEGRIDASVYGRDASDAQLFGKIARFLFYRDSGPHLALTRAQQVEHEAYLTLMAERHGARVPEVVVAATAGPSRDAVLVTRPPPGRRLSDLIQAAADAAAPLVDGRPTAKPSPAEAAAQKAAARTALDARGALSCDTLDDDGVRAVLAQVVILQRAGIAHGAISPDTVLADAEGVAGLVDFRCASIGAPAERLDRDMAAALATLALAVGTERTLACADVLPDGVLAAALPFLQRAALDPAATRALRGRKSLLQALREQGAAVAGVELPKLAEPRRVSWVTLIMVIGTLVGGWALLAVLIDVGKSFDTIKAAAWGWVVIVFLLAEASFPCEAVTVVGSVVDPLPYGRAVALEVANSFVGLAGGSMAVLAARVRFFGQDGYDATLAVSSGVLVSSVSWIVKGALFLIALPLAIGNLHFNTQSSAGANGSGDHAHLIWLIVICVIAVGVLLGAVLAVPRLRYLATSKLRPKVSEVWGHLKVLSAHPRNLIEVFGGCILAQLLVALALGASLHAFGQHLGLATLLVVITLASVLGGISPVPGGMGVVEAGMILGLTAAGISETDAVAAVFVQRLFTSYLPPIWGWFVMVWMRKREWL